MWHSRFPTAESASAILWLAIDLCPSASRSSTSAAGVDRYPMNLCSFWMHWGHVLYDLTNQTAPIRSRATALTAAQRNIAAAKESVDQLLDHMGTIGGEAPVWHSIGAAMACQVHSMPADVRCQRQHSDMPCSVPWWLVDCKRQCSGFCFKSAACSVEVMRPVHTSLLNPDASNAVRYARCLLRCQHVNALCSAY